MRSLIVGLITIYHPERVTARAGLGEPWKLRHMTKSRNEMDQRKEELQAEGKVRIKLRLKEFNVIKRDTGEALRRLEGHRVDGSKLCPFLGHPRLVHIPDEPRPDAKWKLEFRKSQPDELHQLSESQDAQIRQTIAELQLKVKGFWLNPNVDPARENPVWVNLVFVPMVERMALAPARFQLFRQGDDLWVEWE